MENNKETLNNIIHDLKMLITLTNNTIGALTHYIAWKGDEPKFKKHLDNLKKDDKLKENNGKTKENKV